MGSDDDGCVTKGFTWPDRIVGAPDIISLVDDCDLERPGPALVFDDGAELPRASVRAQVERFSAYLSERVEAGDRVALLLPNRAEFMIAWLAIVANRAVVVSVNPSLTPTEIRFIFDDSRPVLAITDAAGAALVRQAEAYATVGEIVLVEGDEPSGLASYRGATGPRPLCSAGCSAEDLVGIHYTSGTSGMPKACAFGHDYWLRYMDVYLRCFGLRPDDRAFYPLLFAYEDSVWHFLMALYVGSTMVAARRFSASRFWDTVRARGVTELYVGGAIPGLLLKQPPSPLDREHAVRFVTGVEFPAALHRQLVERWGAPWLELYGLTEVGIVTAMPSELGGEMVGAGSIGIACPEVDLCIVDGDGNAVSPGEVGELVIGADVPGRMREYLNRPDATAELIRDGWLHTGDLARRDERGFVYFLGRSKDIVRRSSENVSAAEVEGVLREHPLVADAAVVPRPDDLRGEEVRHTSSPRLLATRPQKRSWSRSAPSGSQLQGPATSSSGPTSHGRRRSRPRSSSCWPSRVRAVIGWDRNPELGW